MTTLLVCVALAAMFRIGCNNVESFSRADEMAMLHLAHRSVEPDYDYGAACRRWIEDPLNYIYPGIVRFGHIYTLKLVHALTGSFRFRTVAWLNTLAGIASVAIAFKLGEMFRPGAGVFAAGLVMVSPLGAHLSRRALQDQMLSTGILGAILAVATGHPLIAGVALGYTLAMKESTVAAWPAVALVSLLTGHGIFWSAAPMAVASALHLGAFWILSGDLMLLPKIAAGITKARGHYYAKEQEGAPHRLPTDLFMLGPVPFLLAAHGGLTIPALFTLAYLATHACLPGLRCVRMVLSADSMMRVAAACAIASLSPRAGEAAFAAALVTDAWIFYRVFIVRRVYDPTTRFLVHALDMIPNGK